MKKALITGASSGIGAAVAKKLASVGFDLILIARRLDRLDSLKTELQKKHKINVVIASCDISNQESIQLFTEKHKSDFQDLSLLVNNAGLAKRSDKIFEAEMLHWNQMLDVNVRGLLQMTRAILPHFVAKNSGHVVNIGSVAGRWVYPGGAVYCATKYAVRAISEGMRMDLLGKNIRVTNIEPGMVETEFSEVRFDDKEKAKAVYQGMTPLSADDIAETIEWVVGRPAHVNIQELVIFPTAQASIRDVARG